MKKLSIKIKDKIEKEIKMLLHASRDCLRNRQIDTLSVGFSMREDMGYSSEAFGILRTLVILDYGYFGSSNLNAIEEHRGSEEWQNFKWWYAKLQKEVLEEEGFYSDHVCKHCKERYGKDDTTARKVI